MTISSSNSRTQPFKWFLRKSYKGSSVDVNLASYYEPRCRSSSVFFSFQTFSFAAALEQAKYYMVKILPTFVAGAILVNLVVGVITPKYR
jgi:hypothetical protein